MALRQATQGETRQLCCAAAGAVAVAAVAAAAAAAAGTAANNLDNDHLLIPRCSIEKQHRIPSSRPSARLGLCQTMLQLMMMPVLKT